MNSDSLKTKLLAKKNIDFSKNNDYCHVSAASNELMLNRVFNGKEIDFPFSK